jgi:hypothetical protein
MAVRIIAYASDDSGNGLRVGDLEKQAAIS